MQVLVTNETIVGLLNNCRSTYASMLDNYLLVVELYLDNPNEHPSILSARVKARYGRGLEIDWVCRIISLYSLTTAKNINSEYILLDNKFGDMLLWLQVDPELMCLWNDIKDAE